MSRSWEWISNTGDGCCAMDGDGRILLWNRAAERLLGFDSTETLGRYCYEVIAGRTEEGRSFCQPCCQIRSTIGDQDIVPHSYLLARRRDEREIWLNPIPVNEFYATLRLINFTFLGANI